VDMIALVEIAGIGAEIAHQSVHRRAGVIRCVPVQMMRVRNPADRPIALNRSAPEVMWPGAFIGSGKSVGV
jgi:hypothetical protein